MLQGADKVQASCSAYEAELPWGRRYVAVCTGVNVSDEELARLSSALPLGVVLVRIRSSPDPCVLAVTLTYVEEDYAAGYSRLRNPSLQALLYLTGARQVSQAIEASRGGSVIAVGATSDEALQEALRPLGVSVPKPAPIPQCDPDSLEALTSQRLELIR